MEIKEIIKNISGKCTELTYLNTEKITQWGITWRKVFEPIDRRKFNEIFEKISQINFIPLAEIQL